MPTLPNDRANGDTIDQTWFNILKEWIEYFDEIINGLSSEVKIFRFVNNGLNDHLDLPDNSRIVFRVTGDIQILDAYITVMEPGTSGTLSVSFDYLDPDVGTWVPMLTTNPSVAYNAGGTGIRRTSTNGVVNPLHDEVDDGWFIRLNLESDQVGCRFWEAVLTFAKR